MIDSSKGGCDGICTTPQTASLPSLDQSLNGYDSYDGDSCTGSQASTPRFVSNTSFMLTNSSHSMSSDAAGIQFFDVPRSRNTMREMQDSDQYISFTSEKALPVLPPVTSASVLFGGNRPHNQLPPVSSSSGSQLMFAAETASDDFSMDVLSMIDSMIYSMSNTNNVAASSDSLLRRQKGSSSSLSHQGPAATNVVGRQQPLAFSNPLFTYQGGAKPLDVSPIHTPQNQTPPIISSHCSSLNDNGKKALLTNGSAEHPLSSVPPNVLARNTSPSPSLGHPPIQRAGYLYGCHSHENLPHQRSLASVPQRPPTRNSATPAVSDLDSYFATASGGALSRSMEFPAPNLQQHDSDSLLKRNNTDSLIVVPRGTGITSLDTPPESPTCCTTGHPMGRRNGLSSGTVRMGVRSMQRKLQESEKGKLEV